MGRLFIGLLALGLAACGPSIDATERGGVAQWYGASPAPAVAAAQQHCQRTGRTALVTQILPYSGHLLFSCS